MISNAVILSRCIMQMNGFFGERFCKPMCFIHLIFLASYKPRTVRGEFGLVSLQRSELTISVRKLADLWNMSYQNCRTLLKTFVKEERITMRTERKNTIIKIVNYDIYQFQLKDDANAVINATSNAVANAVANTATAKKSSGYNEQNSVSNAVANAVSNAATDAPLKKEPKKYNKESIITKENIINKLIISKKGGTPFPSAEIIEFWNAEMDKAKAIVPRMKTMTDLRKRMAAARLREYEAEDFVTVIENCAKSNFLNGHNDRGWTPDFTWAMGPDHFAKILEGRYDNVTTNAVNTTAKFNVNDLWK